MGYVVKLWSGVRDGGRGGGGAGGGGGGGGGGVSANKLRTRVTFYDLLINCCYLTVASFSLFLPIRHVYL